MLEKTLKLNRELINRFDNADLTEQDFRDVFENECGYGNDALLGQVTYPDGVMAQLYACTEETALWCEVRWYDSENNFVDKSEIQHELVNEYVGYCNGTDAPSHLLKVVANGGKKKKLQERTVEIRREDAYSLNYMMQHDINLNYYRSYKKNTDYPIAGTTFDDGRSIQMRVFVGDKDVWCKGEFRDKDNNVIATTEKRNSVTGEVTFTDKNKTYTVFFNEKAGRPTSRKTLLKKEIKKEERAFTSFDFEIKIKERALANLKTDIDNLKTMRAESERILNQYKTELAGLEK